MTGCCPDPHLTWRATNLPEPTITCMHCGFRIYPDGILLDWLDLEEIEAARILKQRMPRILELAVRLGLLSSSAVPDQLSTINYSGGDL